MQGFHRFPQPEPAPTVAAMDDPQDRDDTPLSPSMRTIAVVIGVIALISLGGLTFLGGQVTTILSNVGNSIGVAGAAPGGGDTPDPLAQTGRPVRPTRMARTIRSSTRRRPGPSS